MNPRTFGSSIWLLAIVAAVVLCIGAFTHFDTTRGEGAGLASTPLTPDNNSPPPETPSAAAPAAALNLPANLSPGLAEVIKLAQAHVADETIVAFIQTSGQSYKPTADEILYLNDLGVSEKVINSLFKKPDVVVAAAPTTPAPPSNAAAPQPSAPATTPEPIAAAAVPDISDNTPAPDPIMTPPSAPTDEPAPLQNPKDSYFFDSLSPYGSWVQLADGTWVWQPMASTVNPDWAPYRDRGHWVLTDDGWYWASDYAWGWVAFHYGRWKHENRLGWVWRPGSVWAPAWVAWRNSDTYSGWAPLPPGAPLDLETGLFLGQGQPGFDANFGLTASSFTFVTYDNFLSRRVGSFAAPASGASSIFRSTTSVNNYSVSSHKVLNLGVRPDRVAAATGMQIKKLTLQDAAAPDTGVRGRRGEANQTLSVFRPNLLSSASASPSVQINKSTPDASDDDLMQKAFAPKATATRSEADGRSMRAASPAIESATGSAFANFRPSTRTSQPDPNGGPGGTRTFSHSYDSPRAIEAAYDERSVPANSGPRAEYQSRGGPTVGPGASASENSQGANSKYVNK